MPTPHYKISIALGDAGILRIYPFNSNCLILENADDVDFTPINFPNSRTVGGYPKGIVGAAFADRNPSSYVKPAGI